MQDHLIPPHGGALVNLIVSPERAAELKAHSREWPSWDLTPRQLCDAELLLSGGFSPLHGFMSRADYERTCSEMRLANGTIWPIPIVLDVPEAFAKSNGVGKTIALRDPEGVMLADTGHGHAFDRRGCLLGRACLSAAVFLPIVGRHDLPRWAGEKRSAGVQAEKAWMPV